MENEGYMALALRLAEEAGNDGEVPVGCVITDKDGKIIGRGRNRCESAGDATAHAELEAIREASAALGSWRLSECSLYVTLEPCPMCAGAIINSRIKKVFYGAKEERTGSCGSVINLFMENYPSRPQVVGGVMKDSCREVLGSFFEKLRKS